MCKILGQDSQPSCSDASEGLHTANTADWSMKGMNTQDYPQEELRLCKFSAIGKTSQEEDSEKNLADDERNGCEKPRKSKKTKTTLNHSNFSQEEHTEKAKSGIEEDEHYRCCLSPERSRFFSRESSERDSTDSIIEDIEKRSCFAEMNTGHSKISPSSSESEISNVDYMIENLRSKLQDFLDSLRYPSEEELLKELSHEDVLLLSVVDQKKSEVSSSHHIQDFCIFKPF
ncbi:hypothetical protein CANTEDRAFT_91741 [Yamadazyma tenuis ATCC 10573]|uniref:Uncharacterized protein n=1 Tax=Candida tenuis (strain ATCC 10573 / BCRC 21748 / CBS 615 / JCM 9827 / NBRC 10315 / NRRL Y-1498 / VKM Y-70) TaxID=590646 RepID=G3AWM4_CANTC|nr:uncharacterized protein CANTEDRAFT_91741 [Yamadazyma tenuis ATCC 10573]EGV66571.1 hypothetical protein CANTEDRAFT_91741 [Yamadazyma tenuis ATCC 10573]